MRALCGRATAQAFLSLVESFRLPVLEAMAHGGPVVEAWIEPIVEICTDAAVSLMLFERTL